MNPLAHQGGWDEVLLPVVLVAFVLILGLRRRRVRDEEADAGDEKKAEADRCRYCGTAVGKEDERCPSCGFSLR